MSTFFVSSHINPLYSNEFFLLVLYNKLGIAHCTYLEVSGYIFLKKYCIHLSEDLFYLHRVDPGVASSIPARSHTFVEIDHEIISAVILLPSAESFKKGCCQLQAKVCARSTG